MAAERDRRKKKFESYAALCRDLGVAVPDDADGFHATQASVGEHRADLLQRTAEVQNELK